MRYKERAPGSENRSYKPAPDRRADQHNIQEQTRNLGLSFLPSFVARDPPSGFDRSFENCVFLVAASILAHARARVYTQFWAKSVTIFVPSLKMGLVTNACLELASVMRSEPPCILYSSGSICPIPSPQDMTVFSPTAADLTSLEADPAAPPTKPVCD